MELCLAVLAVFSVAMSVLAAVFLAGIFMEVAVGSGRIGPIVVAALSGLAALLVLSIVSLRLPPAVQFVEVPLIAAAVGGAVALRGIDWRTLGSVSSRGSGQLTLGIVGILGGIVGAYFASLTNVGKAILVALDQDVVGKLPSEVVEIRVTGAIFGFLAAAFSVMIVWITLFRRRR